MRELQSYATGLLQVGAVLAMLVAVPACGVYGTPADSSGGGGGSGFGPIQYQLPTNGQEVTGKFQVAVQGTGISRVIVTVGRADSVYMNSAPFVLEVDPLVFQIGPLPINVFVDSFGSQHEERDVEVIVKRPRPPLADMLASITQLRDAEWYEIPFTELRDIEWVAPSNEEFLGSVNGIFTAASGGVFDSKRDRLVIWGGGSGDWRNEIYAFDFGTLEWIRVTDPTPWPVGGEGNAFDLVYYPADNAPVARKSWSHIAYLPEPIDRFVVLGGVVEGSSGRAELIADPHIYNFNFDTNEWSIEPVEYEFSSNGASAAVDENGIIWIHGSFSADDSYFLKYNPVAGTTETGAKWPNGSYPHGRTAVIDNSRKLYISIGDGGMSSWDLTNPSATPVDWVTTGDNEILNAYGPGLVYRADLDKLVAWAGGGSVYTFDIATKVWTKHDAITAVAPGPQPTRGTHGRFIYVPSLDVFVAVNAEDRNVFVYRLPE